MGGPPSSSSVGGLRGGSLQPCRRRRAPRPRPTSRVLPPGGRALRKRSVALGVDEGSMRKWGLREKIGSRGDIRGGDPGCRD